MYEDLFHNNFLCLDEAVAIDSDDIDAGWQAHGSILLDEGRPNETSGSVEDTHVLRLRDGDAEAAESADGLQTVGGRDFGTQFLQCRFAAAVSVNDVEARGHEHDFLYCIAFLAALVADKADVDGSGFGQSELTSNTTV